ncbi:DUF7557 family protein [Methanoculleus bourgensis]|uniref:Uncharacterized protein n=1 Tax=Methanoculleus bourgensis TaxID=83986 RepID=A0A0X3BI15_9EURY|nr:conserved protein of unknown function [Methanoculleus bourgensis]
MLSFCCQRRGRHPEHLPFPRSTLHTSIAAHRSLVTTIQLRPETRARLDGVTVHPRESYDETLNRLLGMAYDPEPLSEETLKMIEDEIADIRAGRYRSLEDSAQEPGLE